MTGVQLRAAGLPSIGIQARIKLANLLELPESQFESRIREIEAHPLFCRLRAAGVLSIQTLPLAHYAQRTFEGHYLRASNDGLAELLNGDSKLAKLITRVGRQNFEECFLKNDSLSDGDRANVCSISPSEARALREFLDQLYVRSEFISPQDHAAAATVYSSVAKIELEDGRPVIGFFSREIWKGRYTVNQSRYLNYKATLKHGEATRIEQFIRQVELVTLRQTTLYRVLETLITSQKTYWVSGNPVQRRPLTQRETAIRLAVAPSVLNRLIANKSVETPWHLEIPLKTLFPNRKTILRERLYDLAIEHPNVGDNALREKILHLYGTRLSRSSIIQYRKELGLGGSCRRSEQETSPTVPALTTTYALENESSYQDFLDYQYDH